MLRSRQRLLALGEGERRLQSRERRAQLVGHVAHQLLTRGEQALDLLGHAVEVASQRADFVVTSAYRRRSARRDTPPRQRTHRQLQFGNRFAEGAGDECRNHGDHHERSGDHRSERRRTSPWCDAVRQQQKSVTRAVRCHQQGRESNGSEIIGLAAGPGEYKAFDEVLVLGRQLFAIEVAAGSIEHVERNTLGQSIRLAHPGPQRRLSARVEYARGLRTQRALASREIVLQLL